MRTILSFAVVVLAGAAGEIAIAHAMKQIGEVHSFSLRVLAGVLRRAIRMVWLWIGVVLIALGFFFYACIAFMGECKLCCSFYRP